MVNALKQQSLKMERLHRKRSKSPHISHSMHAQSYSIYRVLLQSFSLHHKAQLYLFSSHIDKAYNGLSVLLLHCCYTLHHPFFWLLCQCTTLSQLLCKNLPKSSDHRSQCYESGCCQGGSDGCLDPSLILPRLLCKCENNTVVFSLSNNLMCYRRQKIVNYMWNHV